METAEDIMKSGPPRLLIVEPEQEIVTQLTASLHHDRSISRPADGPWMSVENASCDVVESLQQLHAFDLSQVDVVICGVTLPDGSGLDALAYVRGTRPSLPVILTGGPSDAALAEEAIRAGAMDFHLMPGHDLRTFPIAVEKCLAHQQVRKENERLQRDLTRSLAELEVRNQQLETLIHQLEAMARTDELTGLANRRWLNIMLEGTWAESMRHGLPLACLMIDLDGFKSLNDRFGHQKGDEMLRLIGRVIEANSRDVDVAARYGGDEFCVLMPHTRAPEAARVAERILKEFEYAVSRMPVDDLRIGMSIGLADISVSRPINAYELIKHADEALYAAKFTGKNRIMIRDAQGVSTSATAA